MNTYLKIGLGVVVLGLLVGALYLYPPKMVWRQDRVITVTGTATSQVSNEVARFSAGVNAVNDNKQQAIDEVNSKITAMIETVKQFGIEDKDIKTQNMSIYQMQEPMEPGSVRQRLGQWNVNNTVEITLREVARANELTKLLSDSGANNVYGPNFSLDADNEAGDGLMNQAIEEARKKAESMAAASGARLGKVLVVNEGGMNNSQPIPMMREMGGGGGMPTEPGSSSVSKTVTVTFELK